MSSLFATNGSSPAEENQPAAPFEGISNQELEELQADMAREIPENYDVAAAQRRFHEARARRNMIQASTIRKAGIQPDPSALQPVHPEGGSRQASKKFRVDSNSSDVVLARKIYSPQPAAPAATATTRSEEGGEDWMRYFHGRFHELPLVYQQGLRKYFAEKAKAYQMLDEKYDNDFNAGTSDIGPQFDLVASLCSFPQLAIEIGTYLRPRDLVHLYSISRHFHKLVNDYLTSSMSAWANTMAPSSALLFPYQWYEDLCMPDPTGRPNDPGQ